MKSVTPTITATTYTPIAFTMVQPNWATIGATKAQIPSGASSSTQCTILISARHGAVGEVGEDEALVIGQRSGRDRQHRDEDDHRQQIPIDRRAQWVGRHELDHKAAAGGICSTARRTKLESAGGPGAERRLLLRVMEPCGRMIAPTANPMTIATSVVPQKNASVRRPSRPSLLRFPRPATPDEHGAGDERDHHHGQQVEEQRTDRPQPACDGEQHVVLRRPRRRGPAPSRPAGRQPSRCGFSVCALYFPNQ
mgnify:CR=1 FL=1